MLRSVLSLREPPLRDSYDVVVVGGGVQGLALAYNVAKAGCTNVAVLDKGYLAGGASGRNSGAIMDTFSSPEWIRFFHFSLKAWETISDELDCNVMFAQRGILSIALTENAVASFKQLLDIHAKMGTRHTYLDNQQVRKLVPQIAPDVKGGLLNSEGGIARHDALVWGYAKAADRLGVEIHSGVEVVGIDVKDGAVRGVSTSKGKIRTARVVHAAGGHGAEVGKMAGVDLPIETLTLEKFVTDAVKPVFEVGIRAVDIRCSIYQTSRGEFVAGSSATSGKAGLRATHPFLMDSARKIIRILPSFADLSVIRQWGGRIDTTPDHAPLLGEVEHVKGLFLNAGWGGYGFMSAPGAGKLLAPWLLRGERSELISAFDVARLKRGALVQEALIPVHH